MELKQNVILLKTDNRKPEPPENTGKTYRTPNAPEIDPAKTYRTVEKLPESDNFEHLELENSLFIDLLANEKGRKQALVIIKSEAGRRMVVNAITTNGLDKTKVILGLTAVLREYQSGQICRIRALCEDIATDETPRKFLENSIIPMTVDLGIIIRSGDRSAYWQPHNLMGKSSTLYDKAKQFFELTPIQRELKDIADQTYAEQQKLKALHKREAAMQQQKQAYMRITTQGQQLAELAGQHPQPATFWDKAKANPGATLIIGTLAAGILLAALGNHQADDAPMPVISAALQAAPEPTPDTAAVAALETDQIRQQMEAMK